jgi:hypothetical protein
MFHCGGTAVVYDVPGHEEYIRHDVNSLVVPMGDEAGVIDQLNLLKHHPDVLERLKQGARRTAGRWPDWDIAGDRFEQTLGSTFGRLWPDRSFLSRVSDQALLYVENDIVNIKRRLRSGAGEPETHCCQFYWHHGEGFTETRSQRIHYHGRRWVRLETRLTLSADRVNLRIDPSLHPGIIFAGKIAVRETETGRILCRCDAGNRWLGLEIDGTATLIETDGHLVVEAYGGDPQFIVPPVSTEKDGTEIQIETTFKFEPFPIAVGDLVEAAGNGQLITMRGV